MNTKRKKILLLTACIVLIAGLLASIGLNIYFGVCYMKWESYLQSTEEIYIMEAGILRNNLAFADGEDHRFGYDFTHEDLATLKSKYAIEKTAKDGTEFERALRLMDEYAPRLTHKSNYDNHIPVNALDLLAYSLDKKNQGINCRNKAQILNEMCLSIGIYARKVWIMPYSGYDNDCHVVNEIWDGTRNKWIMLDITNNEFWVDDTNTPLSVLEIREKAAKREFCTPVHPNDSRKNLQKLKDAYTGDFLYIVKNLAYTEYCSDYSVGEDEKIYLLMPENIPTDYEWTLSRQSVERSPLN